MIGCVATGTKGVKESHGLELHKIDIRILHALQRFDEFIKNNNLKRSKTNRQDFRVIAHLDFPLKINWRPKGLRSDYSDPFLGDHLTDMAVFICSQRLKQLFSAACNSSNSSLFRTFVYVIKNNYVAISWNDLFDAASSSAGSRLWIPS